MHLWGKVTTACCFSVLAISLVGCTAQSTVSAAAAQPAVASFRLSQLPHDFTLANDAAVISALAQDPAFFSLDHNPALQAKLASLETQYGCTLGVALINEDGAVLVYGNEPFALMSVIKFHLGYAVLATMAERGDTLSDTMTIKVKDLDPHTYSPMYASLTNDGSALKKEELTISLGDLIYYTVRESDNNACDLLITKYLGGAAALEKFWHDRGVTGLAIKYTEGQMAAQPSLSYDNNATPYVLAQSYVTYLKDNSLPQDFRDYLDEAMLFAPTGTERIQYGVRQALAERAPNYQKEQEIFRTLRVFDKTGMGAFMPEGYRIALNDLAFISFEGKPYIMAVLIKDIKGTFDLSIQQGATALQQASYEAFSYALELFH